MADGDFFMTILAIVADPENALTNYLQRQLHPYCNILRAEEGRFRYISAKERTSAPFRSLLLCKPRQLSLQQGPPCFLVLGNGSPSKEEWASLLPLSGAASPNTIVIADSGCQEQRGILAQWRLPVITCGLSPKDTVTFSSRNNGHISIALQRDLVALDGETVEPFDLPFPLEQQGLPEYYPLCFAAIATMLRLPWANSD